MKKGYLKMKDKEYDLARLATYIEDEIEDKDLKFTTAEEYMKDREEAIKELFYWGSKGTESE